MIAESVSILPIWEYPLWGNRLLDYVIALVIFLLFALTFKWAQWLILRSLDRLTLRTATEFDNALVAVVRIIRPPFYTFVAFYIALKYLTIHGLAERIVTVILLCWLVYQTIRALQIFMQHYLQRRLRRSDTKAQESITRLVHSLSGIMLWTLGGLFVLQNLGVNVTALIAGLGIGGVAVALASQNVLGYLFSSLVIHLDKPFVPGDFVRLSDEDEGVVEQVGVKSTRIRATSGEELVVPNKEITNTIVRNFGRRESLE